MNRRTTTRAARDRAKDQRYRQAMREMADEHDRREAERRALQDPDQATTLQPHLEQD